MRLPTKIQMILLRRRIAKKAASITEEYDMLDMLGILA